MAPAWQDLRESDLVFFFEACEATLIVVMASLRRSCLRLEVLILKIEMRGRDCPIKRAKICNHKIVNK